MLVSAVPGIDNRDTGMFACNSCGTFFWMAHCTDTVSYTHLDVYKRQEAVGRGLPTAVVIGAKTEETAAYLQDKFMNKVCLLYTSNN